MNAQAMTDIRDTASIFWLLVKIAIVLTFGMGGAIPVYQGF